MAFVQSSCFSAFRKILDDLPLPARNEGEYERQKGRSGWPVRITTISDQLTSQGGIVVSNPCICIRFLEYLPECLLRLLRNYYRSSSVGVTRIMTELHHVSKNEKLLKTLELSFDKQLAENDRHRSDNLTKFQSELETLKRRLANAQVLMLDGAIGADDYMGIKQRLEPEISKLTKEISNTGQKDPELQKIKEFGFDFLRKLDKIFIASTLEEKNLVLGLMYPEKMIFNGKKFQTTFDKDIISLLSKADKAFKRKRERQKKNFDCLSQEVTPSGLTMLIHFALALLETLRSSWRRTWVFASVRMRE